MQWLYSPEGRKGHDGRHTDGCEYTTKPDCGWRPWTGSVSAGVGFSARSGPPRPREAGVALTDPDGAAEGDTKTVVEAALGEEIADLG